MGILTENFKLIEDRLKSFPNWKMIYKVLNMIKLKDMIQTKRAMIKLGITIFELVDILSILDEYKLIKVFNTRNFVEEKYSHFRLSKFGALFMKWVGKINIEEKVNGK